ncbi:Prefoldin alpha-like protein [Neocallimastix lanati (nom. inval.)]|uniref:Prefoldin alpha-like protein n=1 Tax=Neocallimastix californiae TaxID=1754190 RepID=A0A1Y2BAM9_9FUNG|nr:Prefoldin alpha-like protein [Neocallimastix sp. JGI-2020a]ORY31902.1 hypothetical protein LY90DRAFT_705275 [Neocallimastix californiae]|eukprot:ORY31902.1 hypothetical protein LY90DRAFT_705275 [Neocallimastix californiae]
MSKDIETQILKYEKFVNDTLKPKLKNELDLRDKIYDEISEYSKLNTKIEFIKENNLKKLRTKVDLGSNFYVNAEIDDTEYIFMNIGYGFHAQLKLDEAQQYIEKKTTLLEKKAEKHSEEIAKIKSHIKLVLETIQQILDLNSQEEQ